MRFCIFLYMALLAVGSAIAEPLERVPIILNGAPGCENQTVQSCTNGTQEYDLPQPNDLVRECTLAGSLQCPYEQLVWVKFSAVKGKVDVCNEPKIEPGTSLTAAQCVDWHQYPKDQVAGGDPPPTNVTGEICLSWPTPPQNTDGSELKDLASFWIYSSATGQPLGQQRNVLAGAANECKPILAGQDRGFLVKGYAPGDYTFASSAVNSLGKEGGLSPTTRVIVKYEEKKPGAPASMSGELVEISITRP